MSNPTQITTPLPTLARLDRWFPHLMAGLKDRAEAIPGTWMECALMPPPWTVSMYCGSKSRKLALRFSVFASGTWGEPSVEAESARLVALIGFARFVPVKTVERIGDTIVSTWRESA